MMQDKEGFKGCTFPLNPSLVRFFMVRQVAFDQLRAGTPMVRQAPFERGCSRNFGVVGK